MATNHYMGLVGDGDNFVGYGLKTNGAIGKVFELVSVESGLWTLFNDSTWKLYAIELL